MAVDVGELSDGQEKGDETKKSGGPGGFLPKKIVYLFKVD